MLGPRGSRPLIIGLSLAVLSLSTGCEDETVCIELSSNGSSCPSRKEAERLIQCSASDVLSIDSEAEIDDGACCYDATKSDRYIVSYEDCTSPNGTGTNTAAGSCQTCATAASSGNSTNLCTDSAVLYDALARCLCIQSCAVECGDNSCVGIPANSACLNCADTFCAVELDDCASDF